MCVSIHPTQLDKPVKVWEGVLCSHGVTTNSDVGDIIVTEYCEAVVKLRHVDGLCWLNYQKVSYNDVTKCFK